MTSEFERNKGVRSLDEPKNDPAPAPQKTQAVDQAIKEERKNLDEKRRQIERLAEIADEVLKGGEE